MQTENSSEKHEAISAFMSSHNGEYIEFEGTIADLFDDYFWIGVDFSVSVEDSGSDRLAKVCEFI